MANTLKTGNRYIVVPPEDIYEYNEGDLERAFENEEPLAGELVARKNEKIY